MNEVTYYAVMEQSSPVGVKHEILEMKDNPNGSISRLKFRACMQDYGKRNRNGRLWNGRYMKALLSAPHILELLQKGFPGENGHPFATSGDISMQRIMTIDPNNICHKILNFQWEGDERVYSDIETISDIDGPGTRFALNIMQGFEPAFSVRSVVPQKKNRDGTIDVMEGGRVITFDRVFLPSHEAAYRDVNIDIKRVTTAPQYQTIMESLTDYTLSHSDNVNYAMEGTDPIDGTMGVTKEGMFTVSTRNNGRLFIPTEKKIATSISHYMKHL